MVGFVGRQPNVLAVRNLHTASRGGADAAGPSFGRGDGRPCLVGSRIHRDQLDIEIPEHLERAVEPGEIRDPSDQGGFSILHAADFEALDGRNQSRAQCPSDLDLERTRTQFDSFRWHDISVLHGHVGDHPTKVDLDRCETMRQALDASWAAPGCGGIIRRG